MPWKFERTCERRAKLKMFDLGRSKVLHTLRQAPAKLTFLDQWEEPEPEAPDDSGTAASGMQEAA